MGEEQGKTPKPPEERKPIFDDVFCFRAVLAPWIWHLGVWICMFAMLALVGYLDLEDPDFLKETRTLLTTVEIDHAARRGALAFSGVTLAISVALSAAGFFWAWSAWKNVFDKSFRVRVRRWVYLSCGFTLVAAVLAAFGLWGPFTAELGNLLLEPASSRAPRAAAAVPILMFLLSCVVPSVLLAGACFLLEPIAFPEAPRAGRHGDDASTRTPFGLLRRLGDYRMQIDEDLACLRKRLRELDQMLYIGALALVFGTLQLSAGLSIPLASLPKKDDVKVMADLCKAISLPAPPSVSAFGPIDPEAGKECKSVQEKLTKLDKADGLRQFVRNVTLGFGLAFSAMLAAIYVPALLLLRERVETRQSKVSLGPGEASDSVDPVAKIGAVVATLSPLLAGLVANILAAK